MFNGQTVFLKDLIREVIGIPLGSRAEAMMQYEIRKTKKKAFVDSMRPVIRQVVFPHTKEGGQ